MAENPNTDMLRKFVEVSRTRLELIEPVLATIEQLEHDYGTLQQQQQAIQQELTVARQASEKNRQDAEHHKKETKRLTTNCEDLQARLNASKKTAGTVTVSIRTVWN